MNKTIIGLVGFIGSGKGTVASYLVDHYNFQNISFASNLKDAVSAMFGWPRHLLEGNTKESREWREHVDTWWAKRLDISHLTPRWVLQNLGTDILRKYFHDDIWIASLEYKLLEESHSKFVLSDLRFPNEIAMLNKLSGQVWWIQRGQLPEWSLIDYENFSDLHRHMTKYYPQIHSSEWSWLLGKFNHIIKNDQDIVELHKKIDQCLQQ